jgi:hypothetical protein
MKHTFGQNHYKIDLHTTLFPWDTSTFKIMHFKASLYCVWKQTRQNDFVTLGEGVHILKLGKLFHCWNGLVWKSYTSFQPHTDPLMIFESSNLFSSWKHCLCIISCLTWKPSDESFSSRLSKFQFYIWKLRALRPWISGIWVANMWLQSMLLSSSCPS